MFWEAGHGDASSVGGNLDTVLMNVAHVLGLKLYLFSLHEVTPKSSPTIYSAGVRFMGCR